MEGTVSSCQELQGGSHSSSSGQLMYPCLHFSIYMSFGAASHPLDFSNNSYKSVMK